ncbi:MAG: hypothetical protein D6707_12385, partial [Bacteroidetes bacterium]
MYYGLEALKPLFDGKHPIIIPSNLIPANSGGVFHLGSWIVVLNDKNTITGAISVSPNDRYTDLKLLLPVPWSGKTKLIIRNGLLPCGVQPYTQWLSNRKTRQKIISVRHGFINIPVNVQDFTLIRVKKLQTPPCFGVKLYKRAFKWKSPVFIKNLVKVSFKRVPDTAIRVSLLPIKRVVFPPVTVNYKSALVAATKGKIDKIDNVVPWDSKSLKVEMSYPNGKAFFEEWAKISFEDPPSDYKECGFWVYPYSSSKKIKKVTLMMYFDNVKSPEERVMFPSGKYRYAAVLLKTGVWQRIILSKHWFGRGPVMIVGNPSFKEYRNGNKVSFEFNGFYAVCEKRYPQHGRCGL